MQQAAAFVPELTARPEDAAPADTARALRRRNLLRWGLMAAGVLVAAGGGLLYWLSGGRYQETDDAYVQADSLMLSTDVSGIVAAVPVREGQAVRAGDVLFGLDPQRFQYALDKARADLDQVRLNVASMKADYQAALQDADSRRQQVSADKANYGRYAALAAARAVTQQETDDARYKLAGDVQAVAAAESQARAQLAKLAGNPAIAAEDTPAFKEARSQVDEAERELRHSVVRAPFDGTVTGVSKLQVGMYLAASAAAFALVSDGRAWVQAQPKETQLTWVKAGDKVAVTFALYPGRTWQGTVQSLAPATDQTFSLLPAQNASGNWVQVVQRIPVRIDIDGEPGGPPLRAGMSADVSIDTGHVRHLSDLF